MIRAMTVNDIDDFIRVTKECLQEMWEYAKGYYPKRALEFDLNEEKREEYVKNLQNKDCYFIVNERDRGGEIVGAAKGMIYDGSGYSLLGWIGIHPSKRRKGYGKELLNGVIEHCKKRGCHKISLNTLPVSIPAINLYLKMGFVPESYLRKQWWGVDFIVMSKWLDE